MGTWRMAFGRVLSIAVLLGSSVVALGDEVCSADGECDGEENSLLTLRAQQDSETRRRLPPTQCINAQGTHFSCAGGDSCCIGACVGMGDVCCVNVNGEGFPCQGGGGGCCGNACFAPGSKCCKSAFKPKSQWYPVTMATQCAQGFHGSTTHDGGAWNGFNLGWGSEGSVKCRNREGTRFNCAAGDSCCAGACVHKGDICCKNVNGDGFPCQGQGGGCCGNACYAPGSKCCKSHFKPKSQWYPVTKETKCADGFVGFTQEEANETSDSTLDVAPADEFIDLAQEEAIEEATEISDSTSDVTSENRRRLPPTQCRNRQGTSFECAGGDHCCVGACVGRGDVC